MKLSPEDTQLFHKLFHGVLAYTSQQLKIVPGIHAASDIKNTPPEKLFKIRNALYDDANILNHFIIENPENFSADELKIVGSWRHWVVGDFYIFRHLKKYTIFLSSDSPERIYGVLGQQTSLEDMVPKQRLPQLVKTGLLPFRDVITYDGLLGGYSLYFGGGIKSSLKETYNRLKRREGIVETMVDADGNLQILTSLDKKKATRKPPPDFRPMVDEIVTHTKKLRNAETDLQTASFGLLRAAAALSQTTLHTPTDLDEHFKKLKSVKRALTRMENLLFEEEYY